jgi:hypothetical protein
MRTPSTTTQIILQMPVLKSYLILFNYVYLPTYLWHFLCTIPHIYPILLHISYIHIIIIIYIYIMVLSIPKKIWWYIIISSYTIIHMGYMTYDLWPWHSPWHPKLSPGGRQLRRGGPADGPTAGGDGEDPGRRHLRHTAAGGAVEPWRDPRGPQGPPGAPRRFLLNGMDMKYISIDILYDIHMPISSHISVHIMIYEYLWHLWMMILIYIIDVNHKRIICG